MNAPHSPKIHPFRFGWTTGTSRPKLWGIAWILWTAFVMLPLLTGWLLKLAFDALSSSESITGFLVLLGIGEAIRWVVFAAAVYVVVRWWVSALTVMRTNMLEAQTVSGGPRAATLPDSPAEAISRFHDDARDAVLWPDAWVDGSGYIIYAASALAIMSTIDGRAAFVVLVPLIVVTGITRYLTPRLHAARSADRSATGRVTAFLGETFTGMLAFRLAGREEAAIARLETLTATRRRTAVRDTVLSQAIDGMSSSTSDITVGLTLLVLVPAVRSGDFTVGDLALFAGGFVTATSSTVDIYDAQTNTWSTAELSQARNAPSATSVGTKAMFAGGLTDVFDTVSSRVDIYDAQTGIWSTSELSVARYSIATATLGDRAFFAGGRTSSSFSPSDVVDIYDATTDTWSTA